jgi:hypothetical protein
MADGIALQIIPSVIGLQNRHETNISKHPRKIMRLVPLRHISRPSERSRALSAHKISNVAPLPAGLVKTRGN